MRKLVLFMHMSLDGYVASTNKNSSWDTDEGDVFETIVPKLISNADTLLLGRLIADELLGYWLNAEASDPTLSKGEVEYARWATSAKKVVLSKVEEKPTWPNAEIRVAKDDEDMLQVITDLKKQSGKDIIVHGGVRTVRDLVRLGLVDEYQLVVHPVILGSGLSIFDGLESMNKLHLKATDKLKSGVVFLDYTR